MSTPSPDPQNPHWRPQGSPQPYGQPGPADQAYPPNQPFPQGQASPPAPPNQPPYPPGPPYPPSLPNPLGGAGKPKKKRGRVLLVVLGVFLALVVIGSLAGRGGDSSTTTATGSGQTQGTGSGTQGGGSSGSQGNGPGATGQAAAARIGTEVRDGDFAFVVTKVETGIHQLGSGAWSTKAQGEFILVRVTVTNIGKESAMFSGSSQKLFDEAGREFEADSGSAAMYIPDSESFLNKINPGNSVKATVVFDVPTGLKPAAIELHDSPFSGGATVSLR